MDWVEVLKIIGGVLLVFLGLILLHVLAWFQATQGMSEEEKQALADDIAKNGLYFRADSDPWDF